MKTNITAVILSALVIPGAGQIIKKHYARGGALIAATTVALALFFVRFWTAARALARAAPEEMVFHPLASLWRILVGDGEYFLKLAVALVIVWIMGIVDAWLAPSRADGPL